MPRRFLALLFIILLLITGCGPKEGLVVDKRFKPDLSYWGTQTSCTTVNGRSRCTTSPHWYSNPAQWILVLKTPEGKIKDKHVRQQVYYTIEVGDYYKEN